MLKKFVFVLISVFLLVSLIPVANAQTGAPADPKKHTELGKYVTAHEAYEMWKASPDKVKIIDVRTPEEYAFIGHPPMAVNIPSKLWTGKWSENKKDYSLEDNAVFVEQVKKTCQSADTILLMCRSGHRSAAAVNALAKAGFVNVYNVSDGFEGDKVSDSNSYFKGKRMTNGWKNSIAPWTYDMDPKLVYLSVK